MGGRLNEKVQHTFEVVPRNIFQCLIQEDYWDRNLQDHDPLGPVQGGHLEDQLWEKQSQKLY